MTDVIEVTDNTLVVDGGQPQTIEVGYIAQTVQEGGGVPASTVVAETTYGQAPSVGDDTAYARQDHTHGTPALGTTSTTAAAGNHTHNRTVNTADSGFITTGDITVDTSFTQLGPDLTLPAAAGDILELDPDVFCSSAAGSDIQIEAATRVSGADAGYWSSGTGTSRWPGGIGRWYAPSGTFNGPRGPARYTVQAGDVVAGQVTVRLYGRVAAGSRIVTANANYPLRWTLTNLGAPAS